MNHAKIYESLIETRKKRKLDKNLYYEKHHIVMKSMGGTDEDSNIVFLTAREHFLAHWLLWRIHRNRQTASAFFSFKNMISKNHKRSVFSSIAYSEAREAFSITRKKSMTGVLNSNRSKIVEQYSLDGTFLRNWPSAREAERSLKILHITDVCRGKRNHAGNFKWKFKNCHEQKTVKKYKIRTVNNVKNRIPIIQRDINGKFLAKFDSISHAVVVTKIPKSTIQLGISSGSSKGFKWEKINKKYL